jgi:hypothetical protein
MTVTGQRVDHDAVQEHDALRERLRGAVADCYLNAFRTNPFSLHEPLIVTPLRAAGTAGTPGQGQHRSATQWCGSRD